VRLITIGLRLGIAVFLAGCGPMASAPGASTASPAASTSAASTAATVATPTVAPPTVRPLALLPALPAASLDAATAAALQKVLDDLVANGAPDAIAAVITADGQWAGAAGVDGPNRRAAGPADMFNVASTSKTVLAALILRLAQDGKVDLDAPLSNYLGDLPVDANGATVRQALGMHSGIGDTPSDIQAEARTDCGRVWSRTDVLRSIPTPNGSPGTVLQYSNPTYKLLGLAAAHVTGKPLESAYEDLVFGPMGVAGVLQQAPTSATPKPWAVPIAGHEGSIDLAAYGTGGALPCTSLATFSFQNAVAANAPDLARWGWGLFSGSLLDQASLTAMTTVQPGDSADDPDLYGLGIEQVPDLSVGSRAFAAAGSQVGYKSFMGVIPDRQIVAVVFINDDQEDAQAGVRKLIAALGT
jgi:D-alanyl-D-alanine carboxypeptidase